MSYKINGSYETQSPQTIEQMFSHIPEQVRMATTDRLSEGLNEYQLVSRFNELKNKNHNLHSFAGYGYYRHFIPEHVKHISSLRQFVTSYTPYQPEVAQGTLQILFEYQTQMAALTSMDIANASLYDAPTSLVEAIRMALRTRKGNQKSSIFISNGIHPQYREVLSTYFTDAIQKELNISFSDIPLNPQTGSTDFTKITDEDPELVVFQNPNVYGVLEQNLSMIQELFPEAQVAYGCNEPHLLTLLDEPVKTGAGIVWGEAQPLGIDVSFGGPSLGYIAATEKYLRQMPGRLVGLTSAETSDNQKTDAYVITLATREQHIRREKATSNICSNQTLMAIRASAYMGSLGKGGLDAVARQMIENTDLFISGLKSNTPASLLYERAIYTHEVAWQLPSASMLAFQQFCLERGVFPGVVQSINGPNDTMISYFSEIDTKENIDQLLELIDLFLKHD